MPFIPRACGHPRYPWHYVLCISCGERIEDGVTAQRVRQASNGSGQRSRHRGCPRTLSPEGGLLTGVTCHGGPVMEFHP